MTGSRSRRVAVIDIGSNSVRLVIYSVWRASALPIFNEKVMAGLGRGLSLSGQLSQDGREAALAALQRYRAILDALEVGEVRAVATAAVRVASDGADFAREAALAAGVPLTILSGRDEGRLSAEGVAAGIYRPTGLVGDIGGSSLELHPVGERILTPGESHMLGPLSLAEIDKAGARKIRQHVEDALDSSEAIRFGAEKFYAVGGAWRALAKLKMARDDYPLRVLNAYRMSAKHVSELTEHVLAARGSKSAGQEISRVAGRRASQLHLTAAVLDTIVKLAGVQEVIISSGGLREGVVRDMINGEEGAPLIDGVIAFAKLNDAQVAFGQALCDFVEPVFEGSKPLFGSPQEDRRIRLAACLLADSASRFHPDNRDDMAYEQALRGPYSGLDHSQRAFIAEAIGNRYARAFRVPAQVRPLSSKSAAACARRLGLSMRLGAVFSARSAPLLQRARLSVTGQKLRFQLPRADEPLVSETVRRRLSQLADDLERDAEVVFD